MPMHSLAYRKNESEILQGRPPLKYIRIVPYVRGDHAIEIGSAEGVLALLLAAKMASVLAVERSRERHDAALELHKRWGEAPNVSFANGDILEMPQLFDGRDSLVAIRMIYHLGEAANDMLAEAVKRGIKHVVLGGNSGRERRFLSGLRSGLGEAERFATRRGMKQILKDHDYRIVDESADEGDPIIMGIR